MTLWNKAGVVPAEKLELFSFENNTVRTTPLLAILYIGVGSIFSHMWVIQYARIVREALCELELPYVLQNVGEGSSQMDLLLRISGSKEVKRAILCISKQ